MFNLDSTPGPSTSTMTITYDYVITTNSMSPVVTPTVATTVVTHGAVHRPPVFVSYRDSELASMTAKPSRSGSQTSSDGSLSASTSQASESPTDTSIPDPSPGLSTGAKAGIGVGSVVVVIILFVVVAFVWRRRAKKEAPSSGEEIGLTEDFNKVELATDGQVKLEMSAEQKWNAELDVRGEERVYHELHGDFQPREMPS